MVMIKRTFITLALATLACASGDVREISVTRAAGPVRNAGGEGNLAVPQRPGFITVEGATLQSRLDAAKAQGRAASPAARFWTAYSFDVRPGVAVDVDFKGGSSYSSNGTSFSFDSKTETRNLGVFLLHESDGGAVSRVEVYNLDRTREYSGYRVYWLGRGGNEESLKLLQSLISSVQASKIAEHSVIALALHDDPRVGGLLKDYARQSTNQKTRTSSIFWLGQIGGETPFLADLVRDSNEPTEVRKQAAFAIGVGKDKAALTTLLTLYGAVAEREVKKQIIFAASINENGDDAVDFLIRVAKSDPDREAQKQAIFWLGQKAGQKSLAALNDALDSNDADTEVQKQAVFAISQRPKDESVPMLIKIARNHAKPGVRKQAIFWLGQTGDERAVDFFKEVLTK
jgi:HEAT repeat protein